jgi:hypothetical protein
MPERTAVDQLARLDAAVNEARERLRVAQHTAAIAPRAIEALRSELADYEAAVTLGRREPDPAWAEKTQQDIAARSVRLVTRRHGIAPGSDRQVDLAAEAVVDACGEQLRAVEDERRRFAADHLDELRDERAHDDEAAADRLRAALAEVRDAHAEFDARRGWWASVISAAGLTERLHAPGVPMPGALPWPRQVRSPQPTRRPPRELPGDPPWASGVGLRRAADFAAAGDDQTIELPGGAR